MDAQTSRLPANLSHAPHDVKLWIVEMVKARSYKSLKALRGVNKEWQALVDPHLWASIRLEPKRIEDLERFILGCLVHVGPHVRSLSIKEWNKTTNHQPSGERDAPYIVRDRISAIEEVLGLPARGTRWPLGTWGERIARVQNALLARALASCTALEKLSVTGSLDIVTHVNSGGFDIKLAVSEQTLGGWTIWDKILEDKTVSLPPTLRTLVIDNGTISVRGVESVAQKYGNHLVALELSWLNNSLFPDPATQPFHFPKLKALKVRAAFSVPFLRAFAGSPLEHVELFGKLSNLLSFGPRPPACRPVHASGLRPDDMSVAIILEFLKEHKSTLKTVKVYDKLLIDPPAEHVAILQWCGKNGVQAEMDHTPYL